MRIAPLGDSEDGRRLFSKLEASSLDQDMVGYILSVQVPTALTRAEFERIKEKRSWEEILELVFPDHQPDRGLNQMESLARPLPEILGPIELVDSRSEANAESNGKQTAKG